jgi:hypothetical protein
MYKIRFRHLNNWNWLSFVGQREAAIKEVLRLEKLDNFSTYQIVPLANVRGMKT